MYVESSNKFKLTPVSTEERIVSSIAEGLEEVKLIEAGELPAKDAKTFLDELDMLTDSASPHYTCQTNA